MLFSKEQYIQLRGRYWYRITNGAWNRSGINHPKNIGYLINHIGTLRPKVYAEWENYFLEHIADRNAIRDFAETLKVYVLCDTSIASQYDYEKLDILEYEKMVECRLIYETWIGYFAEITTGELLRQKLRMDGYEIELRHMSPEDDNKYAVDYLLYEDNRLVCGVQVKSCNYKKSKQGIVKNTIRSNERKNKLFSDAHSVPVFYVYYKSVSPENYKMTDSDDTISLIETLL